MIGVFVLIAISWLLLYLIERKTILALGLLPVAKRLKQFLIGFLITAVLCVLAQLLESHLKSSTWVLNKDISTGAVLQAFWWDFKSVLTEELIFRGALLYLLIQKIGATKSILISAIGFGIYH